MGDKYIKYIVPKHRKSFFDGKKVLYGRIIQEHTLKGANTIKIYKVSYINYYHDFDVLDATEVEKINLLDKIKIFFMERK